MEIRKYHKCRKLDFQSAFASSVDLNAIVKLTQVKDWLGTMGRLSDQSSNLLTSMDVFGAVYNTHQKRGSNQSFRPYQSMSIVSSLSQFRTKRRVLRLCLWCCFCVLPINRVSLLPRRRLYLLWIFEFSSEIYSSGGRSCHLLVHQVSVS